MSLCIITLFAAQSQGKEVPLLTEEKVSAEILDATQKLLYAASHQSGKTPAEILLTLTTFKAGVEGKDDLRFISEKQLVVVRDKLNNALVQKIII